MLEELFLKYALNELTEREMRRLRDLLSIRSVAREFVLYMQEWTLIADYFRNGSEGSRPPTGFV